MLPFRPHAHPNISLGKLDNLGDHAIAGNLLTPRGIGYASAKGREIMWDNAHRLDEGQPMEGAPPYCLFQYTLSGGGWFRDSQGTRALKPGQAFLVPVPSQTAYGLRSSQSWEWIWFTFRGELAFEITQFIVGDRGHLLSIPKNSVPMRYLSELYDDHVHHRIVSEFLQAARLYAFLMELCDLLFERDPSLPTPIRRAARIIETAYADPDMSVSSLAEAVGLSRYHFSRQFKQATGETPGSALRARRMHSAMERIQTGFDPLRQVAEQVGFRNYSYFSAVFREFYGTTPAKMRAQQMGRPDES